MSEVQQCTKCGEVKQLTDFHKDKRKKSGRTSSCKVCRKRGKYPKEPPTEKACTKCGTIKAVSEYPKLKTARYGYISYCKSCYNERYRTYRKNNRGKINNIQQRWAEKNRDKMKIYQDRWRANQQEPHTQNHRAPSSPEGV